MAIPRSSAPSWPTARARAPAPLTCFREVAGSWTQEAQLVASNADFLDYFGAAVAIDGDRAIVGATDAGSLTDPVLALSGAAYVFDRSGTTWTETGLLVPDDPVFQGFFGFAVDIDGNRAAVGSWAAGGPVGRPGAVYVFEETAGVWSQTAKILADDAFNTAGFGWSLTLAGDELFVGAPFDNGVCAGDPFCEVGAVYQFVRRPGTWNQAAKLTPPDFEDEDHFGISVALSADTVVVGTQSSQGGTTTGSAYVYTRAMSGWDFEQKLLPAGVQPFDLFGASVAIEGDRVVVGAPRDDAHLPEAGAFYLFTRSGTVWSEILEATAPDTEVSSNLGTSIRLRGDTVLVAVPKDDHPGNVHGSIQRFELYGDPLAYCTAKTNSLGCAPIIGSSGTPGLADAQPFFVTATDVISNKNGLLFYGLSGPSNAPFLGGTLCVQPPLRRTTAQNSGGSPPPDDCSGSYAFDFDAWFQSGADPLLVPGTVLDAQYWMRDPADPFGVALSGGLEFAVCL